MQFLQHSFLILFIILCCFGERSTSLPTPKSTISTSNPSETVTNDPNNDATESTSTVPPQSETSETSETTTTYESNDLITFSSTISPTIGASSGPLNTSTSSISDSTVSTNDASSANSTFTPQDSSTVQAEHYPTTLPSRSGANLRSSLIACPEGYIDIYATDGTYSEEGSIQNGCRRAKDCLNVGWAANKSKRLDVMCVFKEDKSDTGCCYKETKGLCSQGMAALPLDKCETLDDCNMRKSQTTHRWCDPVSKYCCRFEKEHPMVCPDNTTALMNEPFCTDYKEGEVWSGNCPKENGICKHGHCCPSNKTDSLFPGTPYETNQKCTHNTVISQIFGYCNPRTSTVFVMSEMNFHGQKNKNLTSYCLKARDCGQSFGMDNVCVRVKRGSLQCYINPESRYHIPQKRSLFWVSSLSYMALGTSLLSLLFSILYKIYTINDPLSRERSISELSEPLVSVQQ